MAAHTPKETIARSVAPGDTMRAPGAEREAPLRKLVVNADDFGWSHSINLGTIEAHRNGIVTSASLMANCVGFDHAVELAAETPTLDMGVHLNLFRGRPILPLDRVSTLIDDDGLMFGSVHRLVSKLIARSIDLEQVAAEFRAQIERIRDAGIQPSHADSDKHLHLWPSLFAVTCRVAAECGIPRVRLVREPLVPRAIPLVLTALSSRDAAIASAHGLSSTDTTIGVGEAPTELRILDRLLAQAGGRNVELIVHPGHIDQEFWDLQQSLPNKLSCAREEELEVLCEPEARRLTEDHGYTLARHDGSR